MTRMLAAPCQRPRLHNPRRDPLIRMRVTPDPRQFRRRLQCRSIRMPDI